MSIQTINLINILMNVYSYPEALILAYMREMRTSAERYAFCLGVIELEKKGFKWFSCTCRY